MGQAELFQIGHGRSHPRHGAERGYARAIQIQCLNLVKLSAFGNRIIVILAQKYMYVPDPIAGQTNLDQIGKACHNVHHILPPAQQIPGQVHLGQVSKFHHLVHTPRWSRTNPHGPQTNTGQLVGLLSAPNLHLAQEFNRLGSAGGGEGVMRQHVGGCHQLGVGGDVPAAQ